MIIVTITEEGSYLDPSVVEYSILIDDGPNDRVGLTCKDKEAAENLITALVDNVPNLEFRESGDRP